VVEVRQEHLASIIAVGDEEDEEEKKRKKEEKQADIKSNNPHLTGGENPQHTLN